MCEIKVMHAMSLVSTTLLHHMSLCVSPAKNSRTRLYISLIVETFDVFSHVY